MFSTFKSGQRLLACNAYWLVGKIRHNDIIVFRLKEKDELVIKRVYKLGNENVDWIYMPKSWKIEQGAYKVPEGNYYVLGDNLGESEDSRVYGPISSDQVIGKVVIAN